MDKKRNGRCFSLRETPPVAEGSRHSYETRAVVIYSSSSIRPRRVRALARVRRRGAAFVLHSGQGEIMLSVLAAGGVAPVGTIQSSTDKSERQPPSIVTIRPASMPRVFTR